MTNKNTHCFVIDSDSEGQRIDNFLFKKFKNVPKSHIYKMLRKGNIRVNKKRVKPEYHLKSSDHIFLPNIVASSPKIEIKPPAKMLQILQDSILYEDENLIILNKPFGMASHGGSGINFGVIEIMRALRPAIKNLSLVHRIDRDTSGCLILAKKQSILRGLHAMFREGSIEKKYLLLVRGRWDGGKRLVTTDLKKNLLQSGERMVKVNSGEGGKEAITSFRPERIFKDVSLLEAKIGTGRTHQIRVQATHLKHPIAGDEKYGDAYFNKMMREKGLRRMFLHARSLAFKLEGYEKAIKITAPLSEELQKVLASIVAEVERYD